MLDYKETAKKILENHIRNLNESGFKTSEPQLAQFNFNTDVFDSNCKVKLLVYFSNKGNKVTIQGNKELLLYQKVNDIVFGKNLFERESTNLTEPENYIGTDESGKGDYFGPLVIAAVLTNKQGTKKLRELGVRDSKELSDYTISSIATGIKKINDCIFSIVVINPEKYNILYEKMGNLNRLLGWAHAKALENVLTVKSAPEAISDKFGNEKYIQSSLQKMGKKLI